MCTIGKFKKRIMYVTRILKILHITIIQNTPHKWYKNSPIYTHVIKKNKTYIHTHFFRVNIYTHIVGSGGTVAGSQPRHQRAPARQPMRGSPATHALARPHVEAGPSGQFTDVQETLKKEDTEALDYERLCNILCTSFYNMFLCKIS